MGSRKVGHQRLDGAGDMTQVSAVGVSRPVWRVLVHECLGSCVLVTCIAAGGRFLPNPGGSDLMRLIRGLHHPEQFGGLRTVGARRVDGLTVGRAASGLGTSRLWPVTGEAVGRAAPPRSSQPASIGSLPRMMPL
jgi:hypothetical protein